MTSNSKRNWTATLFATLNILDGRFVGRCTQCRLEFICFLKAIEAEAPFNYPAVYRRYQVNSLSLLAGSLDLPFDAIEEPPEAWSRPRRTSRLIGLRID
jgi:hypothetical protein